MQLQLIKETEQPQNNSNERVIDADKPMLTLSELCKELSVSVATGRNWIKLGKLVPTLKMKQMPLFSREYANRIRSDIQSGKNSSLKSRRNKKYISGNQIYHSYVSDESINLSAVQALISAIEDRKLEITDAIIRSLIAECALQLLLDRQNIPPSATCLSEFLFGKIQINAFGFLIEDLIYPCQTIKKTIARYPDLFNFTYHYEEGEDILGLLYISLKNIGNRKATGAYYTPTKIVKKLCHRLFTMNDATGKDLLDPCCGTGNFILQLPPYINPNHVFGNDIDFMSVKIARINYALKYNIANASVIYTHITGKNYLSFDSQRKYDFIIGNPPWGYVFSDAQKQQLRETYAIARNKNIESYDVFIEQALKNLSPNGLLSFVLPEAILNVKTHTPIRKLLLSCCSFQYLEFLGNAFDTVQCPCIILQTVFTGSTFNSVGMIINDGKREYAVQKKRSMRADCFSFSMTDDEYTIIEKMTSVNSQTTLAGKANFALGIVTGNNKAFISREKTEDSETILKGSDLFKFKFKASDHYIVFKPEAFQQVAPITYYRALEKLLYRFICNQLVFAYDNSQTLSLNSCNILIPEIKDLNIKYIMAILNSRPAQFYFQKQFHSVKILRSHIEQIPIPVSKKETQDKIVKIVNSILEISDPVLIAELYELLDNKISKLYGLSTDEQLLIKCSLGDENPFLY